MASPSCITQAPKPRSQNLPCSSILTSVCHRDFLAVAENIFKVLDTHLKRLSRNVGSMFSLPVMYKSDYENGRRHFLKNTNTGS